MEQPQTTKEVRKEITRLIRSSAMGDFLSDEMVQLNIDMIVNNREHPMRIAVVERLEKMEKIRKNLQILRVEMFNLPPTRIKAMLDTAVENRNKSSQQAEVVESVRQNDALESIGEIAGSTDAVVANDVIVTDLQSFDQQVPANGQPTDAIQDVIALNDVAPVHDESEVPDLNVDDHDGDVDSGFDDDDSSIDEAVNDDVSDDSVVGVDVIEPGDDGVSQQSKDDRSATAVCLGLLPHVVASGDGATVSPGPDLDVRTDDVDRSGMNSEVSAFDPGSVGSKADSAYKPAVCQTDMRSDVRAEASGAGCVDPSPWDQPVVGTFELTLPGHLTDQCCHVRSDVVLHKATRSRNRKRLRLPTLVAVAGAALQLVSGHEWNYNCSLPTTVDYGLVDNSMVVFQPKPYEPGPIMGRAIDFVKFARVVANEDAKAIAGIVEVVARRDMKVVAAVAELSASMVLGQRSDGRYLAMVDRGIDYVKEHTTRERIRAYVDVSIDKSVNTINDKFAVGVVSTRKRAATMVRTMAKVVNEVADVIDDGGGERFEAHTAYAVAATRAVVADISGEVQKFATGIGLSKPDLSGKIAMLRDFPYFSRSE